MSTPGNGGFPPAVGRYLNEFLLTRVHPLLLSFDRNWQLGEVQGNAAHYGLDAADPGEAVRLLQDLFLGMPVESHQDVPFVELPNGRSAHVHLIADEGDFHVLLLDAQEERERQRVQQQIGNEEALAGHEKTKAIGKLKQIRNELERQRARLEEANALKNALIATLSHEFRTPLTSIFGYLYLLERRSGVDAGAQQALRAVHRNATYLFALAENLLEYGRGESGAVLLNPGEVDLAALARDLEAMFRPLAEDKGLDFRVAFTRDEPTTPVFDEVRLRQVLINLLSNALRYTTRGEIAAELVWRARRLDIEVCDTGIGIPAEFREQVFAPFNRGGQTGSKGAGLGLSIVKRLVAQMHGELTLESKLGEGSSFRISLPPLAGAGTEAREEPGAAEFWLRGYSVLVVDDDPDVAQLLEVLLTDLGFRVRVIGDAERAVEVALAAPPDVLLVDVELPGLTGNAAVFKLRSRGYGGCIVTLSANATEEARAAALGVGADHYLTKPLNIEQFVRLMQRVARAKRTAMA